jgi:hypothetical protein
MLCAVPKWGSSAFPMRAMGGLEGEKSYDFEAGSGEFMYVFEVDETKMVRLGEETRISGLIYRGLSFFSNLCSFHLTFLLLFFCKKFQSFLACY